jgi:hypothetical protein
MLDGTTLGKIAIKDGRADQDASDPLAGRQE